jgi:hypothetical protein
LEVKTRHPGFVRRHTRQDALIAAEACLQRPCGSVAMEQKSTGMTKKELLAKSVADTLLLFIHTNGYQVMSR